MHSNSQHRLPELKGDKLLSKLSQSSYFIVACPQNEGAVLEEYFTKFGGHGWLLARRLLSGDVRATARLFPAEIQDLCSKGVLEGCGDERDGRSLRLTRAGRAYIKRMLFNGGDCAGQHAEPFLQENPVREKSAAPVEINAKESPLFWLATRKNSAGQPMIEPFQLQAGERLRADYERAHLGPHMGSNWGTIGLPPARGNRSSGSGLEFSEAMMAAKQRLYAALDAIGPELSVIVMDVCCDQLGLSEVEQRHHLPKRSGKVILRMGLNELARHYGLLSDDRAETAVRRRLQHWAEPDYRPVIDG